MDNVSGAGSAQLRGRDAIAGVVISYNKRIGASQVAGVELDVGFFNADKNQTKSTSYPDFFGYDPQATAHTTADDFSLLNMKFGTIVRDTLFYLKGGVVFSRIGLRWDFSDGDVTASNSRKEYKTGWLLGLGAEHMIQDGLSIKAEYVHASFGSVASTTRNMGNGVDQYPNQPLSSGVKKKLDIVRIGINKYF